MARTDDVIRQEVLALLRGGNAHATFDQAIADLAPESRGRKPPGQPHTVWRQVEHLRIAQRDILDFITNEDHRELGWPDDYWPNGDAPPNETKWTETLDCIRADAAALEELVRSVDDLAAPIPAPRGSGQTYLREFLLVADHNAYHISQIILLRRLIGDWRGE